jgi:hypothetical protein
VLAVRGAQAAWALDRSAFHRSRISFAVIPDVVIRNPLAIWATATLRPHYDLHLAVHDVPVRLGSFRPVLTTKLSGPLGGPSPPSASVGFAGAGGSWPFGFPRFQNRTGVTLESGVGGSDDTQCWSYGRSVIFTLPLRMSQCAAGSSMSVLTTKGRGPSGGPSAGAGSAWRLGGV